MNNGKNYSKCKSKTLLKFLKLTTEVNQQKSQTDIKMCHSQIFENRLPILLLSCTIGRLLV